MKKYLSTLLAVCLVLTALSMPASALEYTFDNPPTGDFGTPTSTEDIIQTGAEPANKDRSKSSALIPPGFGTPTSYLPNSGEYLTPNLAADGPLSGNYTLTVTGGTGGGTPALPGAVDSSAPTNPAYPTTSGPVTAFTDVTADLYYSNGSLTAYIIMQVVAVGNHLDQFQRHHDGQDHASNRHHDGVGEVLDHTENAAVPPLRGLGHLYGYIRDLLIYAVEHPR